MGAKNVAQKLAGGFGAGTSRDKLLILVGLAELPRCAVEGLGNLFGGNHLAPVPGYWRSRRNSTIWREKALTSSRPRETRCRFGAILARLRVGRAVEVYSTPCMRSRRFRAVSLGRYKPKRGRREGIELSVAIILRTLRGLQRLCVKFEAAESILAYGFVAGRIEEINKHEFFRVSCKII